MDFLKKHLAYVGGWYLLVSTKFDCEAEVCALTLCMINGEQKQNPQLLCEQFCRFCVCL